MEQFSRHRCMIYDGAPSVHLSGLASAAVERLHANCRCLYLNSPAMVAGMRAYLAAAGIDVEAEVASGALVLTSAQNHLTGGDFDVERMLEMLAKAVEQALAEGYSDL